MSPARGMGRGSPIACELQVSLTVEQDPAGTVSARLVADQPDGLLVEVEFTGDELALLLAGETIAVPAQVSGLAPPEPPPPEPPAPEPAQAPAEPAAPAAPAPKAPAGTALDEPPVGSEPITRSTDVRPGESVLAYIHGRWRDAVVVRRDIGSLLVAYSRPGSFGRVQQRIATDRVRRRPG